MSARLIAKAMLDLACLAVFMLAMLLWCGAAAGVAP
jgi:predicted anti-sigma-YlaC factor YlaD